MRLSLQAEAKKNTLQLEAENVGVGAAPWQSNTLIWFIFFEVSLYTFRIRQTHPNNLQNTFIMYVPPRVNTVIFSTAKASLHQAWSSEEAIYSRKETHEVTSQ